jgi:formylglycine-generating enzyme required for sulfatase activity
MLGNAFEWTQDCWNENYVNAPNDSSIALASGDCSRRVVRGGSGYSKPWKIRAGHRTSVPTIKRWNTGFRLARMP